MKVIKSQNLAKQHIAKFILNGNPLEAARKAREMVASAPNPKVAKTKIWSVLRNLSADGTKTAEARNAAKAAIYDIKTNGFKSKTKAQGTTLHKPQTIVGVLPAIVTSPSEETVLYPHWSASDLPGVLRRHGLFNVPVDIQQDGRTVLANVRLNEKSFWGNDGNSGWAIQTNRNHIYSTNGEVTVKRRAS